MNNPFFEKKNMKNIKKYRDIKLLFEIKTKLTYSKIVFRKFVSHRNKKIEAVINKPVALGISIIDISKTVMYECWYDYVKPKL